MAHHNPKHLARIRAFLDVHPDGWSHADWERLVGELRGAGLLTDGDEEALGHDLERERLRATLDRLSIAGLGPKRRAAIIEQYPRLWELRQASADELASLPTISKALASELVDALR